MNNYIAQLAELRIDHFRGRGGASALAATLGVAYVTLKSWQSGIREPNYDNRQTIAALWQACCGGKQ